MGSRAIILNAFRKVTAVPPSSLLWFGLNFKVGRVPAFIDTDAQYSCVRSDVVDYTSLKGEDCTSLLCSVTCLLADGSKVQVKRAVRLHVPLLYFSWNHEFKILNDGPFPAILGMDFLRCIQMRVDESSRTN